MPLSNVTTIVLVDDKLDCRESSKEDSEAMFIDPLTNFGYIIQKVRDRNTNKNPVIFQVVYEIRIIHERCFTPIYIRRKTRKAFWIALRICWMELSHYILQIQIDRIYKTTAKIRYAIKIFLDIEHFCGMVLFIINLFLLDY